jgi:hypothetical protein
MGSWPSRSPLPGPDPALLDLPWRCRSRSGRRTGSPHSPAASRATSCASCAVRAACLAVKEIKADLAIREYHMLRNLDRLDAHVEPFAVVAGPRDDATASRCPPGLITRHLQFSLPYRALYSPEPAPRHRESRLIDALAVLIVQLHLAGFWWGDVSLSNTLFRARRRRLRGIPRRRRDGRAARATLRGPARVRPGDRCHNIAGELMDLQAGGLALHEGIDPIVTERIVCARYDALWEEVTGARVISREDRWRSRTGSGASTASASTSTSCRCRPTDGEHDHRSTRRSSTPGTTRGGCCA